MKGEIKKKPYSPSPAATPSWADLQWDITANILQRLDADDLLENAQKVCPTWRSVCKDPSMWSKIHLSSDYEEMMCRNAIDRSQGKLLELHLTGFGMDSVLHYASQRSSQLQYLSLIGCHGVTVERTPFLETLCIPRKMRIDGFDAEAAAIATSMSELRHLCISGNLMTNVGLAAILDGCPRLESLSLEQCPFINLSGALGERCSRQIKSLKLSDDINTSYSYDGDYSNK